MLTTPPDPDWFLDHVVVPRAESGRSAGPARDRQAAWAATARALVCAARSEPWHPAVLLACRQGFVVTRDQARCSGLTDAQVRGLVRRRQWSVPRRGVIGVLSAAGAATARPPHGGRLEVLAAAIALVRPGTVVSHHSAAALFGLPLLEPPRRGSVTSPNAEATASMPNARVFAASLEPADVTRWYGVPVTSIARTAVDLARCRGAGAGLAAADAALRERLVTRAELRDAAERARGWPGSRDARLVADLATPFAESALESLTRLFLFTHRIPLPEPQAWVETGRGRYRVDGLWRDRGVVLEVDGLLKYRGRPGRLTREKRRQEALERAGYRVVRVTWADLHDEPAETLARIEYALRQGGRRRAA